MDFAPRTAIYYDKTWQAFSMSLHTHAQVEIMYAVSGRCQVVCQLPGGEEIHPMAAGDYILLDSNVPHRLEVARDHPCQMKNIEFVFEPVGDGQPSLRQLCAASDDYRALLRAKKPVLFGRDPQGHLLRAFDTLLAFYLYSLQRPRARAVFDHAFTMVLLTVAYLQAQTHGGGAATLRRALAFIQSRLTGPLRVEDIARSAGVHPMYLQRLFRQSMNASVLQYVTAQRVTRAAYLLKYTPLPVSEVARECGFGSRQQCYRCFLSAQGKSPAQYRAECGALTPET